MVDRKGKYVIRIKAINRQPRNDSDAQYNVNTGLRNRILAINRFNPTGGVI